MKSRSLANQMEEAQILMDNASGHPEIKRKLLAFGFSAKSLETGKALLQKVILLQETKKEKYQSRLDISQNIRENMEVVKQDFRDHLAIARMAFRKDKRSSQRLGLHKPRASRQTAWIAQVYDFYAGLLKTPKPMAAYGVSEAELEQARTAVESLIEIRKQGFRKKGDAQNATQKRNEAIRDLQRWISDFKPIVRAALRGDEQLLESLGIAVASPA